MRPELMNGKYYEYRCKYTDAYRNEKVSVRPVKEAIRTASDTETDLYLTEYKDGVLISVEVLVGNEDQLDYPRREGNTYYEELPEEMKRRYMMLSRLKSDCDYVLGNGGKGAVRYLRNGNISDHISEMKEYWNSFEENEKPEWLSLDEIEDYDRKMTALCG